ncbi:GNAT family N-acetyltransferase [Rhizobium paknamense]|uniref:RimJ/RimL family protein N-acetyltransferase n=1 Tax=Rhizobium paknamense TaxID=1206817 RepID=A0ABU0IGP8_9HYPH|nr:GNAT family N-acetyltransferase [Rhizobium paknamense]MDQ0457429.1 RimJ/RimL family protein N-acetyltransferase [Rhizobium paknamense]
MNAVLEQPRAITSPGPCPIIETHRLVLRPHRMTDADAMAASLNDWQVTRMLSRVPMPYHPEDARDWLNRVCSGTLADWYLAITEGDDVHIGSVSLELRQGHWHLGYWLNRFYWGQGLMTEAAGAAIDRFLRRMPESEVHSGAFADNAASLRLQQKLGFVLLDCREAFSLSRNAMVPLIETRLRAQDFRRPKGA